MNASFNMNIIIVYCKVIRATGKNYCWLQAPPLKIVISKIFLIFKCVTLNTMASLHNWEVENVNRVKYNVMDFYYIQII